ncbi:metalloendopeptidase OMA1, mitochondrial-like [Brevipalpus obovatus]|uniref:metalloendopeptidase OMA1, mitochondrial-like n=1 Tax=Brevipalpus obovatus TaxID=246614 RepID=UPI003D9EE8FA
MASPLCRTIFKPSGPPWLIGQGNPLIISLRHVISGRNQFCHRSEAKIVHNLQHRVDGSYFLKGLLKPYPLWVNHNLTTREHYNVQERMFHTTRPNHIPPIIVAVLRPVAKLVAVLAGRNIRKWYRSLPQERKDELKAKFFKNQKILYWTFGISVAASYLFYLTHLKPTPVTGRDRFVMFSEEQFAKLSRVNFEALIADLDKDLLPSHHPVCRRVERVARRILNSNKDIDQIFGKDWSIVVVNSPVRNAFAAPNGQIFVFTGILDICTNDDQLGIVLSHEISHSILGHSAEMFSYQSFIDFFVVFMIAMIWAVIPSDLISAAVHFFLENVLSIGVKLPYNRKLETEADDVGLMLASKSCFDVREAVAFWRKMKFLETMELGLPGVEYSPNSIEFISSHPASENRAEHLQEMLPLALKLRSECECPRLPYIDPVMALEAEKEAYNKMVRNKRARNVITIDVKP